MPNQNALKLTVDWLEGTSFDLEKDMVIRNVLQYPEDNFVPTEKGALGYMNGERDGNITIWYNGREGMGVHFKLTGEGCRQYENVLRESENPLFELLKRIESDDTVKLSRLDLAIDDFEGIFSIPNFVKKVKKGELVSRFKKARRVEDMLIEDGSSRGTTLYFGSSQSEIIVRMYEKNLQLGVEEEIPFWNRTEIQLRDGQANLALREICSDKSFGEVCFGLLSNYIRFIDIPLTDRKLAKEGKKKIRKDRYPVNKKWLKFIGNVQKLRLIPDPKEVSMNDKFNHLLKQGSKAWVMLEAANYDTRENIIAEMRKKGEFSMKSEDYQIIEKFMAEREERSRIHSRTMDKYKGKESAE